MKSCSLKKNIETGILTELKLIDVANSVLSQLAPQIFKVSLDSQAMEFAENIIEKSTTQFERKGKKQTSLFGLKHVYSEGKITVNRTRTGYCIRTKEVISFSVTHPYGREAFENR